MKIVADKQEMKELLENPHFGSHVSENNSVGVFLEYGYQGIYNNNESIALYLSILKKPEKYNLTVYQFIQDNP